MSSSPSSSSKRYWPFVAAAIAVAGSVHFLRSEPPAAMPARAHENGSEPATAVVKAPEARDVEPARPAPDATAAAPSPDVPAEEIARNVVGALPQGEREAQRLQVMQVEALVRSGRVGSARAQAAAYFERWPGGPDTAALEALTGAHPRVDRPAQ